MVIQFKSSTRTKEKKVKKKEGNMKLPTQSSIWVDERVYKKCIKCENLRQSEFMNTLVKIKCEYMSNGEKENCTTFTRKKIFPIQNHEMKFETTTNGT